MQRRTYRHATVRQPLPRILAEGSPSHALAQVSRRTPDVWPPESSHSQRGTVLIWHGTRVVRVPHEERSATKR